MKDNIMKATQSVDTKVGKVVWTNRIIQIGYDLLSGDKSLMEDFDSELEKQGLSDKKDEILAKIKEEFGL